MADNLFNMADEPVEDYKFSRTIIFSALLCGSRATTNVTYDVTYDVGATVFHCFLNVAVEGRCDEETVKYISKSKYDVYAPAIICIGYCGVFVCLCY